jgi:DNA integrity scanning protein DisA with diadenylate cyclase activity
MTKSLPEILASLLDAAKRLTGDFKISAVILLADLPYDFGEARKIVKPCPLLVASHRQDLGQDLKAQGIPFIELSDEPQTRQVQITQAFVEAIADGLLRTGDRVITLYASFDREGIDSLSIVALSEHLARLTSRDLQRLETTVPLSTLKRVVDIAVEIGREGREGKPVGTLFVVGNHRKVLEMSHEMVHDPFKGYSRKDRLITSHRVRESVKEIAQLDGAFIISSDGLVMAACRSINAPQEGLTLTKGLGTRHWAAAAVSKATGAIAIAVSQSTGTVRIFQNGIVVLRIEPMDQAMKWADVDTEPPTIREERLRSDPPGELLK